MSQTEEKFVDLFYLFLNLHNLREKEPGECEKEEGELEDGEITESDEEPPVNVSKRSPSDDKLPISVSFM